MHQSTTPFAKFEGWLCVNCAKGNVEVASDFTLEIRIRIKPPTTYFDSISQNRDRRIAAT
jgi:hypothetical protein